MLSKLQSVLELCPHRAGRGSKLLASSEYNADVERPALKRADENGGQDAPHTELPPPPRHLAIAALDGKRLRVRDDALNSKEVADLLSAVRSSPYFGQNLGENAFYKDTYGFHVKFRSTHRGDVESQLPYLKPLLAATLRPECNCFYLNVFFARPDGQEYHTDNFFTQYTGAYRPTDFVTVAYLGAPEAMVGGELVVLEGSIEDLGRPPARGAEDGAAPVLARVRPQPGRIVEFDGRLLHAVYAFTSPEPRISVVIEQCKLARRHFMRTPRFNVYCQQTNREIELA